MPARILPSRTKEFLLPMLPTQNVQSPRRGRCADATTTTLVIPRIPHSKRHTHVFRSHYSALPIALLPPEILCKIFVACARESADDRNWTWINVTHVCSFWRRSALACPPLWGHIDFTHPQLTALTLQRARGVPLSVRATVENHNVKQLFNILQTAPLVTEIDITSSLHGFQFLTEALTRPHTNLKSMTILVLGHRDNRDIVHYKLPFPSDGNPIPSLTHLELHRCPFSLVSPRFISLTNLSLYYLPTSERPELRDFLLTLAKFPLLQSLTLIDAFQRPVIPGDVSDNNRCIRLPLLQSLVVQGGVLELSEFLDHLILSSTVRIRCIVDRINPTQDSTPHLRRLAKALGGHLSHCTKVSPFQKVVLTCREESFRFLEGDKLNPNFRQSLRIRAFKAQSSWENVPFDLSFSPDTFPAPDAVFIEWLTAMWKALPFTFVQTLALQNMDIVTQKTWPVLLKSMPRITVLEINGHAPSGLAWTLLLNAQPQDDDEEDEVLLPRLQDIFLFDVDCLSGGFMVSTTTPTNSYCDLDDSRFLDVMSAYAFERREGSLTLRSFRLFQCEAVMTNVLLGLRKCVTNVYWDHRGSLDEEEALELHDSARYRRTWAGEQPVCRHYHRLPMLLQAQL